MKKHISIIISTFTLLTIILTNAIGSGPPPPLRVLPEEAKMRIGQGDWTDFDFSPDGKKIAIACSHIGIWIHDAHSGEDIDLLSGHTDAVTAVVYSPDGKRIASGSYDKTMRVWDANSYKLIATLSGHTGDTRALAFSSDSKTLASDAVRSSQIRRNNLWGDMEAPEPENADSSIKLWDLANMIEKLTLIGHTDWITALKFSPDDTILASASTDGTVRLWNADNGKQHALIIL